MVEYNFHLHRQYLPLNKSTDRYEKIKKNKTNQDHHRLIHHHLYHHHHHRHHHFYYFVYRIFYFHKVREIMHHDRIFQSIHD
jgi:hypothetical protein